MTPLNPRHSKPEAASRARRVSLGLGLGAAGLAVLLMTLAAPGEPARADQAPEFPSQDPQQWIGPPQSIKGLKGKVIILDVWTFG